MTLTPVTNPIVARPAVAEHPTRTALVELARQSLAYHEGHVAPGSTWESSEPSRYLPALAVLALEGDAAALERFRLDLLRRAGERQGIDGPVLRNRLDDSFWLRSVIEAYHGVFDAGLIAAADHDAIAAWLYEVAAVTVDGRARRFPGFEQWHLRNQNVPATMVYNVAWLLDRTLPGQFDTQPLWAWGDGQMVGWDLTWRGPDDSWLYQFIWTWSAFLHARTRRPELLHSQNALRCFDFYRDLSLPGTGQGMIFGDCGGGDLLGPAVALMLGARVLRDGELLLLAERYLDETMRRGAHRHLSERGPEMYRLYRWWPLDLRATTRVRRRSRLLTSPLPGRGWAFDFTGYAARIKTTDRRFPFFGQNTNCWDAMYQVQDPEAYREAKPDKIILTSSDEAGSLFAAMDLRCHGLHDHADALNLITLTHRGQPWLVESRYHPRGLSSARWLHNVPLVLAGSHPPEALRSWQADTWREVLPGDATLRDERDHVYASALLRHDSFDYVDFASDQFDVERHLLFEPEASLLVVDRLVAKRDGEATVGQIWHTPARCLVPDDGESAAVVLAHAEASMAMSVAHSETMTLELSQRAPGDGHDQDHSDPFYFPSGRTTQVLLWHTRRFVRAGEAIVLACRFAAEPSAITLNRDGEAWQITTASASLRLGDETMIARR